MYYDSLAESFSWKKKKELSHASKPRWKNKFESYFKTNARDFYARVSK